MPKYSSGGFCRILAGRFCSLMNKEFTSSCRYSWIACIFVGLSLYVHSEFGYRTHWQRISRTGFHPGTFELYHGWPIRSKYQLMSNSGVPFITATGSSARRFGDTSEIFPIPILSDEMTNSCDWNILLWFIIVYCTFVYVRTTLHKYQLIRCNSSDNSRGMHKMTVQSVLFCISFFTIFIKIVSDERLAVTHFGICFGLSCVLFELPLMPMRGFHTLQSIFQFKNTP